MGELLGRALKSAREMRGLTQREVAARLGVSRAAIGQWEGGVTEPSTVNLINACQILNIDLAAATGGLVQTLHLQDLKGETIPHPFIRDRRPEMREFESEMTRHFGSIRDLPSDVPVLGVAVGGTDGEFFMNGEVVDYVRRPAGVTHAKDVYAIFVIGSSMFPKYEEGEMVYVAPSRPPAIGDYVVVQLASAEEGSIFKALIKRLARRTSETVYLDQFNPVETIKVPTQNVAAMHRVLPWKEVLGI